VRVRAYSTSANLGPGFDVIGIAIDSFMDVVEVEVEAGGPDAIVTEVIGPYSREIAPGRDNSAAVAARTVLEYAEAKLTAKIKLWKGVPPGRGLGSSGASSAAAARAIDILLGEVLREEELIKAASEGERAAAGSPHPDNVAPSLLGGMVIVGDEIVKIEPDVRFVLAIPWVPIPERKTEVMRSVLPDSISLSSMVKNSSHLASLIVGMAYGDLKLAGKGMSYSLVDEARSRLIPGFKEVKEAAFRAGAYGASISGAGPSMLFLCDECEKVRREVQEAYKRLGIPSSVLIARVAEGAGEVEEGTFKCGRIID